MKNVLIFLFIALLFACKKDNQEISDNIPTYQPEGLFIDAQANNEHIYANDNESNTVVNSTYINLSWHPDSFLIKYTCDFKLGNNRHFKLHFQTVDSSAKLIYANNHYTYSGFFNMISEGIQFFAFDERPIPKSGFYIQYYKNDTMIYTIDYANYPPSSAFAFNISELNTKDYTDNNGDHRQQVVFSGQLSCILAYVYLYNGNYIRDTISIQNATLKAKFDQLL